MVLYRLQDPRPPLWCGVWVVKGQACTHGMEPCYMHANTFIGTFSEIAVWG